MSGGRPTTKTPEVLKRLEDALEAGLTIAGACGYARIGTTTFYRWQEDDVEFRDMVEGAKVRGQALIEFAILKDIKKDPKRALEVARRRYPEWQDRQKTELSGLEGVNFVVKIVKAEEDD